jgi:hypothetical protein
MYPKNITETSFLSPFRFGKRSELRPITEQEAAPVRNILNIY